MGSGTVKPSRDLEVVAGGPGELVSGGVLVIRTVGGEAEGGGVGAVVDIINRTFPIQNIAISVLRNNMSQMCKRLKITICCFKILNSMPPAK